MLDKPPESYMMSYIKLLSRYEWVCKIEGVRRMAIWLEEHGRIENSDTDPFEDRLIAAWRDVSDLRSSAIVD
jgi:hypothetical protein